MRRRPVLSLLLAAALFAGPVLAGAHDSDHGLQPGAAHACAVCVYAHGAGHGALPATPRVIVAAMGDSPEGTFAGALVAVTVRLHPIRGPPSLQS